VEIKEGEVVRCEFYFSNIQKTKFRPVLVLKYNLPYNDFIGIPISSKVSTLQKNELLLNINEFETGSIPKKSKLIIRKPFAISKDIVEKYYGTLQKEKFKEIKMLFCSYFEC
jgi:mRNA interferase MazF